MFGYVKPFQQELKVWENTAYKGVYCGLCKTIGKRYGFLARMTLNYDFTFLAIMKMALNPEKACFSRRRCPVHPLKKRACCQADAGMEYAADAAMLTVYYKLLDSVADDGRFKRMTARFLLIFARRWKTRAAARLPALDEVLAREMKEQADLEANGCASIDRAAEPSAVMLATMLTEGASEEFRPIMRRIGYCLGRWIYLMDAADDLDDDLMSGNYNPFIRKFAITPDSGDIAAVREYAVQTLNACMAECAAAAALLHVEKFKGIIDNVLSVGMKHQQSRLTDPERRKVHDAKESL